MTRPLPHVSASTALLQVAVGLLMVGLYIGGQALVDRFDGRIDHRRGAGVTLQADNPTFFARSQRTAFLFSGGILILAGASFGAGLLLRPRQP
ncbi:MAG: hypothetical protein REJ23_14300 [Brevundimonas sp.]|nr:hypothetical protein [Brevundimonas sp.]